MEEKYYPLPLYGVVFVVIKSTPVSIGFVCKVREERLILGVQNRVGCITCI